MCCMHVVLYMLATVFSMAWDMTVIQCSLMLYLEISHLSLVFLWCLHTPKGSWVYQAHTSDLCQDVPLLKAHLVHCVVWMLCGEINLPISCYWDILLCVSIPEKILTCCTVVVILQEESQRSKQHIKMRPILELLL